MCRNLQLAGNLIIYKKLEIKEKNTMGYFPMFICLEGKKIVVIGGGNIASRRVETLLAFGCVLTVIAPFVTDTIKTFAEQGMLKWERREYKFGDLKDAYLSIGGTDRREINHQVYLEAKKENCYINVIDCKEECDFYFPAVIKKEEIVIGVTASGKNHKKAKETADWIRENLQ